LVKYFKCVDHSYLQHGLKERQILYHWLTESMSDLIMMKSLIYTSTTKLCFFLNDWIKFNLWWTVPLSVKNLSGVIAVQ